MRRPTARGTARAGHNLIHVLVVFGVALAGGLLGWITLHGHAPTNCRFDTPETLPDAPLFLLGVVAFFAGHVLGRLVPEERTESTDRSRAWSRFAMVTVFLVASAVFMFEAVGTAQIALGGADGARLEPITFYVRCGIEQDKANISGGLFTWGATALVFFIAGHWFWGDRPRIRQDPETER